MSSLLLSILFFLLLDQTYQQTPCNNNQNLVYEDETYIYSTTTNLCNNALCLHDGQCHSGFCGGYQSICVNENETIKSKDGTCNTTQYLTNYYDNGTFIAYGQRENRCNGVYCDCHEQCQSGYCDNFSQACVQMIGQWKETECNRNAYICNNSRASIMDEMTSNRCIGTYCECDKNCKSGYCNMDTLKCDQLSSGPQKCSKYESTSCSERFDSEVETIYFGNRCLKVRCQCDNQCESGYCSKKTSFCEEKQKIIEDLECDHQVQNFECFDDYSFRVVSINNQRCENVQCYCDSQCKSGYCQNQKCSSKQKSSCNESVSYSICDPSSISPISQLDSTNLCEGITCFCDSDCSTNICHGSNEGLKTCQSLTRESMQCNQTISICLNSINGEFFTINRCENVMCNNDYQCQSDYCDLDTKLCKKNQQDNKCNKTQYILTYTNGKWENTIQKENLCEHVNANAITNALQERIAIS
ncbi:hypothetical protein FGO68_gene11834 [Halteria grandinella]|uniref:Uncharacterized protein n=1 Tax=Halteria grandinella TaxID=5974 RepID=A0A8J8NGK5_HALGN|nr:hypothetical protein FGO68_gene11834 [Halteria grandinella]